jgi:hypothetical protein
VTSIAHCRILSPRLMAARPALERQLEPIPEPVDVEWLEALDGSSAVAALRPARTGPEAVDPRWVPLEAEARDTVDGWHSLSGSGHLLSGWGSSSVLMTLPTPLQTPIGAFFQGNRHLVPWLFDRLATLAGGAERPVYDLHAGVGFMAAATDTRSELHLVEPFRPAARAAVGNLAHARVAVGRTAEAFLKRRRHLARDALVLTDPPRAGMSPTLRHRLAGWHPRHILMLACDPASWARDAAFLLARGYRLDHLELVDLYPSTHHVEVLAVLESE